MKKRIFKGDKCYLIKQATADACLLMIKNKFIFMLLSLKGDSKFGPSEQEFVKMATLFLDFSLWHS